MADLKTTNIYGDAYINNKVGINTNTPATRLQIGQLSPTTSTEGLQFGDDVNARLYRGGSGQVAAAGGLFATSYITAGSYLQTNNNNIYPSGPTSTLILNAGNSAGNGWISGLTLAQNGNVVIANDLTVNGNTYLGNANNDTVYVNDTIRIGATDSGDASLFFGEGGVAGSDYGARWYWDSGYTFTWYTRNAGTDTALFDYVTNDLNYINWRRHFHMQNKEINYNAQVHFNAGTRFVGNNTSYLIFRSDSTGAGGIQVQDGSATNKGYTGYWDAAGGGILNNTGNWAVRYNFGNANSGGTLYGDWTVNGNISATNLSGTNTGDQTVGNGTITIAAGTGIGVGTSNTFTTNQSGATTVTVTNNGVTSLTGTANRVTVSAATGAVTLNLPQDIHTGASPTFAAVSATTFTGALSGNATTATSADNIDGRPFVNTNSNSATNADTINSNGISYYTGGVTNFSGNATDGALYSQAYSNDWQHQIAGDYRSGQIALRGKNSGTWQSWRTVLDSTNYSSYAGGLSTGNTFTNINVFNSPNNTTIGGLSGNYGLTVYQGTAGTDAYMTFHVGGDFAGYFGLGGAENDLVWGGWSVGNFRYRILHSSNAPYAWNMNQYVRTTDNVTFGTVTATLSGTATYAGAINSDTGNVGENKLQYWQTSGNTALNPDGEWYNAIRMGHGNPVTYYSNTLAVRMTGGNLGDIYTRTTTNGATGSWNRFWHNNNDGAGSGLDADLLDGLAMHTGRNNEANKVVRTDSNGYIQAGWINTTSGDMPDTESINKIYCSGDDYVRYKGVADFKQQIGLTYKNSTPRSTSTTDTNYWTGMMGWSTTDFNTMVTWGSGFIDSWGSPGNSPGAGYTHFVGLQSIHYTNGDTDGTDNYGYQLVAGAGTTSPLFLRVNWGSAGSWRTMLDSSNYNSYAPSLTGNGASGNWAINVTGNAATATTLQTARNINGTSFNGSAAITTATWGTARTITIGSTGKSVDGSANVSWTLAEIGAAATNQTMFIGTTSVAINRASAAISLAGTSIDGTAGGLNSSNYISRIGSSGNYNTDFQNTPAGTVRHQGDDYAMTNNPGGGWWFVDNYRHYNASNYWGTQVAWGWEDQANKLATRNVQNGTFGSWIYYLNSGNYTDYTVTKTGTGASGNWAINITGNAATATTATNVTIANGSVTLAKIENITAYTILGNSNASAAATPAALSVATVATMLSGQTMNINGSSTSISGFGNPTTAASGNTIAYRDGNGDLSTRYFFGSYHNSTDDISTGNITYIMAKFGDNYHRSATAAKVAAFITGQTMNINGSSTSCTGNSVTATTATNVAASGITGQTGMWTSAARPGPYRLYRNDHDSAYNLQLTWQAHRTNYWSLRGYLNDTFHAECFVVYSGYADEAGALTIGNTYRVANLGINVAASNKLHINGDNTNPAIRIDNGALVTGVASNSKNTFQGYLPVSFGGTTYYIRLWT